MTNERSIDDLMNEFNDKARAEGRYSDRAFWEVPRTPGSILDVPETPESRERIAWLRECIAKLEAEAKKDSALVKQIQPPPADAAQSPLPKKAAG